SNFLRAAHWISGASRPAKGTVAGLNAPLPTACARPRTSSRLQTERRRLALYEDDAHVLGGSAPWHDCKRSLGFYSSLPALLRKTLVTLVPLRRAARRSSR